MRLPRFLARLWLAAALAVAPVAALGQSLSGSELQVRDAGGATITTCSYLVTSVYFPCHADEGYDGTNWHVRLTDPLGRTVIAPRLVTATKTFTEAASYAAGNDMGGLFTVDLSSVVGAASVPVRLVQDSLACTAATMTGALVLFNGFSGLPATTYADAATPTMTASDRTLFAFSTGVTPAVIPIGGTTFVAGQSVAAQPIVITTDAAGKVYIAAIANASITATTPSGCVLTFVFTY